MADQYDSSIYIGDSDHNSFVVCAKAGKILLRPFQVLCKR